MKPLQHDSWTMIDLAIANGDEGVFLFGTEWQSAYALVERGLGWIEGTSIYQGGDGGTFRALPSAAERMREYRRTMLRPITLDPLYPQRAIGAALRLVQVTAHDLFRSRFRPTTVVRVRWALMICMRRRQMSYSDIGRRMKRDHSTAIHGITMGKDLIKTDPAFARLVEAVDAA